MASGEPPVRAQRRGFSTIEVVMVLLIVGVTMRIALPRLDLSRYRSDAAAQQVRSVLVTAQRMSLTRQYDVIVSFDTVRGVVRIAEDQNNNGQIDGVEPTLAIRRSIGEGNRFSVPPFGLSSPTPTASVLGTQIKSVTSYPSVIFHRDGSVNTDAEIYVASAYRGRTDFRLVTLTRSTGRTDLYRLSGTAPTYGWISAVR
jgi:type II secretory pathway pseudopilin PulG